MRQGLRPIETVLAAAFLSLLAAPGWSQEVIISEIMAAQKSLLLDADGDDPDWIELFNASPQAVNLSGWALTDDALAPMKWKLPQRILPTGGFLVVFASEKDRAPADGELHTNFRLETDGEYLALVRPDGSKASEFAPTYPLQVQNVSYGSVLDTVKTQICTAGTVAQYFSPADDALGLTWTEAGFDAATWASGPLALGYDSKSRPTYQELVQTSVESLMFNLNTTLYVRIPFNLSDPRAVDALLLRIRYEDGFVAYLNGQEVARRRAPATLAWNSKAAGANPDTAALVPETINLSDAVSRLVTGANVLAIHALNDTKASRDFLLLPELESLEIKGTIAGARQYFGEPWAGLPSAGGQPGVAAPPEASRRAGPFVDAFDLTLTSTTPGAVIRYTLDKTLPTETSTAYTAPLPIAATAMVRARVYAPGYVPSPIVTRVYSAVNAPLRDFTSNLPILVIDTFGKPVPEDPKVLCGVTLIEPGADDRAHLLGEPSLSEIGGFKKRGSSSIGFPKNNFALEVWDQKEEEDKAVGFFDFEPDSDWILHGPYSDKTLMRNYLSYDWSNQIGRWAVRCRFVELYLNQTVGKIADAQRWGVYVFMEKIKRGDHRVDIKRLYNSQTTEPEVSGGYIFKKDRLDPGDVGLATRSGTLGWVYPKEKEATLAQKTYVRKFFDTYEGVLYGADFKDPENGYQKYIDVDAFIDHHIVVELTKNIDGYRLSTFMYKDREGKLTMGPVWDYNLSLGNANYLDGWKADGWYYALVSDGDYPWYRRLFLDTAFTDRYRQRWVQHRAKILGAQKLLQQIDDIALYLDETQRRDFVRWPRLGTYIWPNWYIGRTYADEINFMKNWLDDRLTWMDASLMAPPVFSQDGGDVAAGFQLTITHPDGGAISYTINDADPFDGSGNPIPAAKAYTGPVTIERNSRVRARAKLAGVASPLKEATFVTTPVPVVITELMYNPAPPPVGSPYTAREFEFVELKNTANEAYDLTGLSFAKGIVFSFTAEDQARLEPQEYGVIIRNREAFATRYDVSKIKILGVYTGDFSDRSEVVEMRGAIAETVHSFKYEDTWHLTTDGQGYSLAIVDPSQARDLWTRAEGWRPSGAIDGSPGAAEEAPVGGWQRPSDFSQDGQLNLADAVGILRFLFQGLEPTLPCGGQSLTDGNLALLDFDRDAAVNLTDAVSVLRHLFQGGGPPSLGTACVRMLGCRDACVQ